MRADWRETSGGSSNMVAFATKYWVPVLTSDWWVGCALKNGLPLRVDVTTLRALASRRFLGNLGNYGGTSSPRDSLILTSEQDEKYTDIQRVTENKSNLSLVLQSRRRLKRNREKQWSPTKISTYVFQVHRSVGPDTRCPEQTYFEWEDTISVHVNTAHRYVTCTSYSKHS